VRRRAVELLARVEKRELDRERLALLAVEAELAARRDELAAVRRGLAAEQEAAWALSGGPSCVVPYFRATQERQRRLGELERELEDARDQAQEALSQRLRSYKSLELVAEWLQEEEAWRAVARARGEVEEASQLKAAPARGRWAKPAAG
jgi:hypothetical protein